MSSETHNQTTTRRENFFYHNTLCCLLKALENKHTCIDLRNESCVTGLIKHVDGYMNVEMEDVVFYNPRGEKHKMDNFFVHGRNIRYVHIPKSCSATELIDRQLENLIYTKPKKPRTFKQVRAERYNRATQQEIMKSSAEAKPSTSAI